jgi:periplasmic mercuric ion binding protein
MKKLLVVLALLTIVGTPVWAKPNTVTLSVPTMYCPVCPITVKKALTRVPGVSAAEVSLDKRQATVTFDDARTSVEALIRATTEAGYPSKVAETAR